MQDTGGAGMGPMMFFALIGFVFVSQGEPDVVFLDPAKTMDMASAAEARFAPDSLLTQVSATPTPQPARFSAPGSNAGTNAGTNPGGDPARAALSRETSADSVAQIQPPAPRPAPLQTMPRFAPPQTQTQTQDSGAAPQGLRNIQDTAYASRPPLRDLAPDPRSIRPLVLARLEHGAPPVTPGALAQPRLIASAPAWQGGRHMLEPSYGGTPPRFAALSPPQSRAHPRLARPAHERRARAPEAPDWHRITGQSVRLRLAPDLQAEVSGLFDRDARVLVLARTFGWALVRQPPSQAQPMAEPGWVSLEYLARE